MLKIKIKNKKFLLGAIFVLFFLSLANQTPAQPPQPPPPPCSPLDLCRGNCPIVPCELTGPNRCTLCDFFEMLNRIVN